MKNSFWLFVLVLGLSACGEWNNTNSEVIEKDFVSKIESSHNLESWQKEEVIEFDLELIFGGKERFNGRIIMTPDGGRVRMESKENVLMLYDGKEAYVSSDSIPMKKARFDLLTWSYFFAAPFKLSDPGTNIEELGMKPLGDEFFNAAKLTFDGGVGDSPDDWYILYRDTTTNNLVGMAYIVTYSKSKEVAEEDPHLITYESYVNIGKYPIATNWNFWTWNEQGEMKKLLGTASISNLKFSEMNKDLFTIPKAT